MRIVRLLLGVLLVFCVVSFGALIRSRIVLHRFEAIHPGSTMQQAVATMGTPSFVRGCANFYEPPADCAQAAVYAGPLAPMMPEYWVVFADAGGRVLKTQHTTRDGS